MRSRVFTFVKVDGEWMTAEEAERKYGQGFIYRVEEMLELKFAVFKEGRS